MKTVLVDGRFHFKEATWMGDIHVINTVCTNMRIGQNSFPSCAIAHFRCGTETCNPARCTAFLRPCYVKNLFTKSLYTIYTWPKAFDHKIFRNACSTKMQSKVLRCYILDKSIVISFEYLRNLYIEESCYKFIIEL